MKKTSAEKPAPATRNTSRRTASHTTTRATTRATSEERQKTAPEKTLTRTQAATEFLQNLANEAGAGAKLPTFNELMELTGFSKATLSAAFVNLEAARVLQRKHGVGIFVSQRLHHASIALVFEPLLFRAKGVSPYWNLVWNALSDVARERAALRNDSFSFHLAPLQATSEAPLSDDLCDAISARRIDGILAVGLSYEASEFLRQTGVPMVSHAGDGTYKVDTDTVQLVRIGTEYLHRKGCKKIALWNPGNPDDLALSGLESSIESLHSFVTALHEVELPFHNELTFDGVLRAAFAGNRVLDTRQGQGYAIATAIFSDAKTPRPDGILAQDDMLAQGALTAMEKLGVRAGRDVEFVSHANKGSTILLGYEENIARIEYDPHEIASQMFAQLDKLMAHQPTASQILVPPRLVLPETN